MESSKILERYYNACQETVSPHDFISFEKDYVDYIKRTPQLLKLIQDLEKNWEKEKDDYDHLFYSWLEIDKDKQRRNIELKEEHFFILLYKTNLTRIQNYLIEKIENSIEKKKSEFSFDKNSLEYNEKTLSVSKPKNARYYFLLKTLLENKERVWNYDELWEKLFGADENGYDPKNWRKIYEAAYTLNEKIAKETTIPDFLEVTKTTIQINTRYI